MDVCRRSLARANALPGRDLLVRSVHAVLSRRVFRSAGLEFPHARDRGGPWVDRHPLRPLFRLAKSHGPYQRRLLDRPRGARARLHAERRWLDHRNGLSDLASCNVRIDLHFSGLAPSGPPRRLATPRGGGLGGSGRALPYGVGNPDPRDGWICYGAPAAFSFSFLERGRFDSDWFCPLLFPCPRRLRLSRRTRIRLSGRL